MESSAAGLQGALRAMLGGLALVAQFLLLSYLGVATSAGDSTARETPCTADARTYCHDTLLHATSPAQRASAMMRCLSEHASLLGASCNERLRGVAVMRGACAADLERLDCLARPTAVCLHTRLASAPTDHGLAPLCEQALDALRATREDGTHHSQLPGALGSADRASPSATANDARQTQRMDPPPSAAVADEVGMLRAALERAEEEKAARAALADEQASRLAAQQAEISDMRHVIDQLLKSGREAAGHPPPPDAAAPVAAEEAPQPGREAADMPASAAVEAQPRAEAAAQQPQQQQQQQQSALSPQSVEQVVSPPPPVVTAARPVAPIAEDYFEEPLGGLSCDSYLAYLCPDAFLESQQPNRLTLHACIVASLMKNSDQRCGRWVTASISARKTCSLVRGQELEALPELKQCSKHWRTEAAQMRAECLVINQVNVTTGAPYSSGLADPCTHAIEQLITNESASAACKDKSSDSNWKKCAVVSVQQLQAHASRLGPDAAMMYWSQFEHIYSRYGQPSEPVLRAPPVIATDVSQYSQPGPICLRPLRWQQKDLSRIYYVPGAHGLMDFTLSIWVRAERSTDPLCSAKDAAGAEFWFDGCSIASAVPGDYPSTSWASFQTREFRVRRAAGVKGSYMNKAQFHSGGAGPMMNDWGLTVMNDGSVAFGVGHRRFVSPALTYSFAPQR